MTTEPETGAATNAHAMHPQPTAPRAVSPAAVPSVRRVVVVLAKAPVAGRVKTRLVPPATPTGAAGVAAAALLDTLDAATAVPDAAVLVALEGDVADAERADEIADALRGPAVVHQRGDSLGERIAAAHDDAAALFPGAATVQVGMDTPQLTADLLTAALEAVEAAPERTEGAVDDGAGGAPVDAALGLAEDGGWWALALRDPRDAHRIVDVPTSRDDTGRLTRDALHARPAGSRPGRVLALPTLSDVDTADDAVAVALLVPHGRFAAAVGDLLPVPGGLAR
jgi:glycosyltransferase A (GT-A) superfamily protein (DUF2064 family)